MPMPVTLLAVLVSFADACLKPAALQPQSLAQPSLIFEFSTWLLFRGSCHFVHSQCNIWRLKLYKATSEILVEPGLFQAKPLHWRIRTATSMSLCL